MQAAEVIEGFRLAPQQRRLVALGRARGGLAQACGVAVRLRGPLRGDVLRAALASVVQAAEVLRTRLVRDPRSVATVQVIGTHPPVWAEDADWSALQASDVDARMAAWGDAVLATPLDPAQAPGVAAELVRLSADDHLLRLVCPTALLDGASLALLARRVATAYGAALDGGDAAEEGIQFVDVSEWQNDFLEGEEAAEGRRHWKQRLASARGAAHLPGERSARDGDSQPPRLIPLPLPAGLMDSLAVAAASIGVSAEALAMAGWAALLHRLTGQPEVRLARAFPGRSFDEVRDAMGPFARHLPLECMAEGGSSAADLARTLVAACAQAEARLDAFDGDSAAAGDAVSAYGFAWSELPQPASQGGVEWSIAEVIHAPEPFRAALVATAGDAPAFHLQYDPAAFSADAASRLAERAATVLAAIAADPQARVDALAIVGPVERGTLVDALARSRDLEGDDERVDLRFAAQARRTPDLVALRAGDDALTYGEMAERVERLAGHLHALGVGPEVRVAILLDRTADAVVAMLAVLRAGGAYVPLDAAYPPLRLAFMLGDCGAAVLVTDAARGGLAAESGCRVVRIDADAAAIAASTDAPPSAAYPENAAYVIYTSGTTGQPKGTVIEHRALAQYVRAATAALELRGGHGYAVVSTLAADLGATMLYPALCLGGTLHLVPEAVATDPQAWAEYAARNRVHCLKLVPSHLRMLIDGAGGEQVLPRLRLVLGGEAADGALLERVRRAAPGLRIFNHYGPTETTVGVVAGELTAEAEEDAAPPLGRPLAGARIYLLDARGALVPAGVPGEVHVGGGTLARGYLGRPALTAERFVPDAFSGQPGARLYRTGDRGRWREDGRLDFLGRVDAQLKINGHRVEPAEVEGALTAHPTVSAARVVARDGGDGARLVAYVVATAGAQVDALELRRHLRERLPEAFVPGIYVVLPRMPLTPNGKLDVGALPDPAQAEAEAPRAHIPPRTRAEQIMAGVWAEVLGRAEVGATDDFFELGGNSFLAVRLMSRIHKQFGQRLPLAALIGAGTVEGMARLLAAGEPSPPAHLVSLRDGGAGTPLFCVHPGEGTVLCYHGLARRMAPGRPVLGLQALDFETGTAPLVRIEEMAVRYVAAIRSRQSSGPYLLAGWSYGGLVAFEMARQLIRAGADVERVVLFDCRLPVTAPALARLDPVLFRASMLFHASVLVDAEGNPTVTAEELAPLDARGQAELIAARAGTTAQALLPSHIPPDQLERYLDLRMARSRGVTGYEWHRVPVPITLVRAASVDLETPFPEMRRAYEKAAASPDYGWGALTRFPVEVVVVQGDHHSLFAEPNLPGLAVAVDGILSRDRSGAG